MFLAEARCAATLVSVMTLHLMDDKKNNTKKNIKKHTSAFEGEKHN